jgi:SAM-dependent methyltransferase
MLNDDARLLTDREYLRTGQYRSDANLAARQSIYQFQRPRIDLAAAVLDLAGLHGSETVADVGCGNGVYLAELARRGHVGPVLGIDLSPGMLQAARDRAAAAGLAAGDAAALPVADGVADVTLAMHMLYHVPDRQAAARELRRVTRDGGQVLVVLNDAAHLAELRALVAAAARDAGVSADTASWAETRAGGSGLNMDGGAELLAGVFGSVERHDFVSQLVVPGPGPVLDYIASMWFTQDPQESEALVAAAARRLQARPDGVIRITTRPGLLICR